MISPPPLTAIGGAGNSGQPLSQIRVGIKGAGEMASAVAWRLFQAHIRKVFLLEIPQPLCVRRGVSFCEAVYEGRTVVENVEAVLVQTPSQIPLAWAEAKIPLLVDPRWESLGVLTPDVVVDAILAKRNLGTSRHDARLVIALGPGFCAGRDCHVVVQTNRGHHLGRLVFAGPGEENTGIPEAVKGFSLERIERAPVAGRFRTPRRIGDALQAGDLVGHVGSTAVRCRIDGVLRGLLRPGISVAKGTKLCDIDPRGVREYCWTISDKARAIAGSVLEALLRVYNRPPETSSAVGARYAKPSVPSPFSSFPEWEGWEPRRPRIGDRAIPGASAAME